MEESGGGAGGSSAQMPPLRITIPTDSDGRSPAPSPTGNAGPQFDYGGLKDILGYYECKKVRN